MRVPKILAASLLASLTLTAGSAAVAAGSSPKVFDSSRFSQSVTECDRMASHPDDPNKVIPGLERAQMDLEAAIVTCRADLAKDSANPRLLYLLARALTYAGRVDEASEMAKVKEFDLAILDVNLDGNDVFPVADIIAKRGLPFMFVTGYGGRGLPEIYRGRPTLQKPFQVDELKKILSLILTA